MNKFKLYIYINLRLDLFKFINNLLIYQIIVYNFLITLISHFTYRKNYIYIYIYKSSVNLIFKFINKYIILA